MTTTPSYIGFDILPMSSTERQEGVKLAASALFEDGKRKEWSEIKRKKLLRLIRKHRFRYVGTDNPSEIIAERESVASFCDNLPSTTSLVHVNLARSGNTVPLKSLLLQYNIIPSGKKLSPVKTARALVDLMIEGVGMVLEPYENETLIKVGKPSSSSKGGWSQARYQRQAEEVVGREASNIRKLLTKADLPFDEIIHDTKFGAKMARFHIFKARAKVDEVLSSHSFYPAKVKIWSPQKHLVTHRPLSKSVTDHSMVIGSHYRRIIVGIDPGMTTGVAIINLNAKVKSVFSRKNLSKGQLITEITKFGVPVLVCADVTPIPTFVSKIAATYNAPVMSPEVTLSKEDKRYLSRNTEWGQRLDSHERDALAAVLHAYKRLEDKFEKIDAEGMNRGMADTAKGLIINGLSVKESILSAKQQTKKVIEPRIEDKDYHKKDIELLGRINNLQDQVLWNEEVISNLRAHAGRLEAKNTLFQGKITRLERVVRNIQEDQIRDALRSEVLLEKERQIKVLKEKLRISQEDNQQLLERVDDLEKMLWVTIDNGGTPVKILEKFSNDAISKLSGDGRLERGDLILILDPTGGGPQTAEKLALTQPKFVFVENYEMPKQAFEVLYEKGIPVLRGEKYGIIRTNYLGIINQKNLLQAREDYNLFAKKREDEIKTQRIFQTIEDYKYERAKHFKEKEKSYDDFEITDDQ